MAQMTESERRKVGKTVLKIVILRNDQVVGNGSGVVVGDGRKTILLTNDHVAKGNPSNLRVIGPDGKQYKVERAATNSSHDIAVLTVPGGIPNVVPAAVERRMPPPGTIVKAYGYPTHPDDPKQSVLQGVSTRVEYAQGHNGVNNIWGSGGRYDLLTTSDEPDMENIKPGMSGGGVLEWIGGKPVLFALNSIHAYNSYGSPPTYTRTGNNDTIGQKGRVRIPDGAYNAFVPVWESIINGRILGKAFKEQGLIEHVNFRLDPVRRRSSVVPEDSTLLASQPLPDSAPNANRANQPLQDNLVGSRGDGDDGANKDLRQAMTLTSAMTASIPPNVTSSLTPTMHLADNNFLTAFTG
ncbi:MAG: serine protease [Holosporales bacterium]|jgi:hypothetical protein